MSKVAVVESGPRALGARRHRDPGELGPGQAGGVDRVGRVVVGQPGRPNLLGDAETSEGLHRAGRDGVALRVRRSVGESWLDHNDVDAAHGGVDGKARPDRTCAGDDQLGFHVPLRIHVHF